MVDQTPTQKRPIKHHRKKIKIKKSPKPRELGLCYHAKIAIWFECLSLCESYFHYIETVTHYKAEKSAITKERIKVYKVRIKPTKLYNIYF